MNTRPARAVVVWALCFITGLAAAAADGALVFHAGTHRTADGGWITAGGRLLTVVGLGADLAGARGVAEAAADHIAIPGARRRRDIGLGLPAVAGAPA